MEDTSNVDLPLDGAVVLLYSFVVGCATLHTPTCWSALLNFVAVVTQRAPLFCCITTAFYWFIIRVLLGKIEDRWYNGDCHTIRRKNKSFYWICLHFYVISTWEWYKRKGSHLNINSKTDFLINIRLSNLYIKIRFMWLLYYNTSVWMQCSAN